MIFFTCNRDIFYISDLIETQNIDSKLLAHECATFNLTIAIGRVKRVKNATLIKNLIRYDCLLIFRKLFRRNDLFAELLFSTTHVLVVPRGINTRVHYSYASMQSLLLGAPRPTNSIFRRYAHISTFILE